MHSRALKLISPEEKDVFSQTETNSLELKKILTDKRYGVVIIAFLNFLDNEIPEVQMVKSLAIESRIILYRPDLGLLKMGQQANLNSELVHWYETGKSLQLNALSQVDMVVVGSEAEKTLLCEKKNDIHTVTVEQLSEGEVKIPKSEKKKVSIIILTFNQLCDTKRCVETLERNTKGDYELVFVDNGSVDDTKAYLEKLKAARKNVKTIYNPSNLGFAKANNQGMGIADGEYVVFLNNDVVLTEGWLERMISCAESDPAAGIVGPVTNHAVGEQVVDKSIEFNEQDINRFACMQLLKNAGYWFETHRIIGFCMLMKREVIENVGMLDERFGPGGYEDYDFCLRVKQAGYKILVASDVFIYHIGGEGYKKNNLDYDKLRAQNVQIFIEKWCRKALEFLDRLPDGM